VQIYKAALYWVKHPSINEFSVRPDLRVVRQNPGGFTIAKGETGFYFRQKKIKLAKWRNWQKVAKLTK
ncbi:29889_t:CDS:1, partial [Gigaspora margarita]